ncbi:MAG: peptidoglycan-binding protein [Rhizobiales bacterium]|nr:peptidoglycan-binding protein [Hyphomicrobiales bacterium]
MGRSSKARVRDVLDEREGGVSPGAAALAVFAMGLGGMIVWNAFFGAHDQAATSKFVTRIPKGATTYVEVAAPAKPTTSITITYDPQVEDVQRELLATGHYRGLVDGVTGKQTVIAIKSYQRDNQLPITGQVTKNLLEHIRYTRKVAAASEFTGSVAPEKLAEPQPLKRAVANQQVQPAPAAAAAPAPKPQGLARVRDVQQKLRKLGYDIGAVTGEPDDATRAAILKFEMDFGLSMDGSISKELVAALKVAEAAAAQR